MSENQIKIDSMIYIGKIEKKKIASNFHTKLNMMEIKNKCLNPKNVNFNKENVSFPFSSRIYKFLFQINGIQKEFRDERKILEFTMCYITSFLYL
jgi:hypothetical protein